MSEADRRRENSVYDQEQMVPERLLHDLAKTPVLSEQQIGRNAKGSHQGDLTPPELEVVKLLSHGYSSEMIAEQLLKGSGTIKTQIKSAKASLNAKTREHLVAIALRRGLIS